METNYIIEYSNLLEDNENLSESDDDSEVFEKIEIEGDNSLYLNENLDDFEVKKIEIIDEIEVKKTEVINKNKEKNRIIESIKFKKNTNENNINYKKILIKTIEKFNLENKHIYCMKGKIYEYIVLKHLKKINNYRCWMWKDIPIFHLFKSNIITKEQFYCYSSRRSRYRNNPISDIGIDILVKDKDNYIFIQCKNHRSSICYQDLAGYFMMLSIHSNTKGIVYHTSDINRTLREFANRSDRCTYIRLPI